MNLARHVAALVSLAFAVSCGSSEKTSGSGDPALAISAQRLKAHVDTLAADELGGRICGSPGHRMARDYVEAQLRETGLTPFGDDGGFIHSYAARPFDRRFQRQEDGSIVPNATDTCHNLVGILPGGDLASQHVVLIAHYDHLGVTEDGQVFNGAFDDASGVAALLEVARVLVAADVQPRRSIVFLISDQEEQGLTGAGEWLDSERVPRDGIVAGIAVDPVGRGLLPDFAPIVLSGAERSPELSAFLRGTRDLTTQPLGFLHRMMIPIYGSDHDQFHRHDLPGVWLVSPGMTFYHQVSDTADTIDYRVLGEVARYLTRLATKLANDDTALTYVGEPDLDAQHAQDTKDLLTGVAASTTLTETEREQVRGFIGRLDEVLASDWDAIGSPLAFFAEALSFVAFTLPREHPGEIPPPFPE